MGEEKAFFKVKGNKFWILEQKLEEEATGTTKKRETESEYKANAWVFDNEMDAIMTLKNLFTKENINFSNLDESIETISKKYNLQEVEIAKDKYNMKAVSWLKVALLGLSKQ
jgi:hypothetical protein